MSRNVYSVEGMYGQEKSRYRIYVFMSVQGFARLCFVVGRFMLQSDSDNKS